MNLIGPDLGKTDTGSDDNKVVNKIVLKRIEKNNRNNKLNCIHFNCLLNLLPVYLSYNHREIKQLLPGSIL
jgi:hypothetical protein